MKRLPFHIRQGDLLLVEVNHIPPGGRVRVSGILAEGEVTGHAHRVSGPGVEVIEVGADLYVSVPAEHGTVTHEEHNTVLLPHRFYQVEPQEEYDPYAAANRRVMD